MQKDKKPFYKYCLVPMCKNTIRNSPEKLFFLVPRGADIRKKWCENMKRGIISPTTSLYCCEDHFSIEKDTANYMEYKIMTLQMKQKTTLRLKKGVLPHKFDCQKAQPPLRSRGFQKRKLETSESDLPKKSANTNMSLHNEYLEPSSSTSSHKLRHSADIEKKYISEDSKNFNFFYPAAQQQSPGNNEVPENSDPITQNLIEVTIKQENLNTSENSNPENSSSSEKSNPNKSSEIPLARKQNEDIEHVKGIKDEYEIFAKLIAGKIRQMKNPETRDILMDDIQNMVFRACMIDRADQNTVAVQKE